MSFGPNIGNVAKGEASVMTMVRHHWAFGLGILCTVAVLVLPGSSAAQTHNVTFVNRCLQQVWLAELAPSSGAEVTPTTGWALAPRCPAAPGSPKICAKGCDLNTGTCKCTTDAECKFGAPAGTQTATCSAGHCVNSTELLIPEGWSGRFWPRTRCSGGSSNFTCKTGQCGDPGNLDCTTVNKSANRATLFEITTGATNGLDNYDVSLVSGYNLPVRVIPILPSDAPTWKKTTSFADQATITQTVDANSFLFNNIGSAGNSGSTKPKFPATRFATVADGPSITWNNNGPSCETAGCRSDLRAICPSALRVKVGATTIACDSPANVCLNGGSAACSTNATYYACNNYQPGSTKDLFDNYLTLQSPNGDSPVCFSPKDCQPGTTCLMNPTFEKMLTPPLPTGAGVCTPVIQNGGCTEGNEGNPCAAFPFVDYACNTVQLSPTSKAPVCLPPTTAGPGEVVWNAAVWSATATTCTASGGCTGSQQCLESTSVGKGVKECTPSSQNCVCNDPNPCLASRGANDGCPQPNSCLNKDGVPDGGSDGGNAVDCSTSTCYCAPQAIYSGTCGPTNSDWLAAAKYRGVGTDGVGFEKLFKVACPTAYAYQFDDASSDWTCNNTTDELVNYRVVFCPAL